MKDMEQEEVKDVESRILDAAKQVFTHKGFAAATMGDIAAEAGIGRTSLNYYFRTKEMLFNTILENLMDDLLPNIDMIVSEASSYPEKLRKIVSLYIRMIRKNNTIPLFVVNELHRDPQHVIRVVMKDPGRIAPLVKLRRFVESEMEAGRLRRMPVADMLSTLISLVVFPFFIREPLTLILMNGDNEGFEAFLDRRVDLICEVMHNLLKPESN